MRFPKDFRVCQTFFGRFMAYSKRFCHSNEPKLSYSDLYHKNKRHVFFSFFLLKMDFKAVKSPLGLGVTRFLKKN